MAMNFTNATIEVEELIEKRSYINKKIASILTEAINTRISEGKVNQNITRDVQNIIKPLPESDQIEVLDLIIYNFATQKAHSSNGSTKIGNSGGSGDYFNDIFGSRRK